MTISAFANPDIKFDFEWEARSAAVNEACQTGSAEWRTCTMGALCVDCETLRKQILSRLEKAFLAGQMSMQEDL